MAAGDAAQNLGLGVERGSGRVRARLEHLPVTAAGVDDADGAQGGRGLLRQGEAGRIEPRNGDGGHGCQREGRGLPLRRGRGVAV